MANICWSIIWLLILIFVAWWVASFLAWIYILLLPFVACCDCLIPVNEFLLKVVQWPGTCGKNIKEGKAGFN